MENRLFYYLDHCGSTPLALEIQDAAQSFLKSVNFGNSTAIHHVAGHIAHETIEESRCSIANCIGATPEQIIFTSGATEANNLMLLGFALRYRERSPVIIYGATEHKSVFDTCQMIAESLGVSVTEAPVNPSGAIDIDRLEVLLRNRSTRPTLVAIMHTNNEIPARNPIEEISKLCSKHGAFFHCDGVQGYVREKVNFSQNTFGSYVLSPHKIYGPKGIGILILGDHGLSPRIIPPYRGGNHERGLRPGTLNTFAINIGAKAVTLHETLRDRRLMHMKLCAKAFVEIMREIPGFHLTVPPNQDAAGIISFYVEGLDAPTLLAATPEVCINRGAACTGSGGETFSHVPKALGFGSFAIFGFPCFYKLVGVGFNFSD